MDTTRVHGISSANADWISFLVGNYTRGEGECRVWIRALRNGYPCIRLNGKTQYLHILWYILNKGEIPQSCLVTHSCDNRACLELKHLNCGTHASNSMEKFERNDTVYGEKWYKAQLTNEQAREIYALRFTRENNPARELAKKYGISRQAINDIWAGRTWGRVV